MNKPASPARPLSSANRDSRHEPREGTLAWLAGFAELFVWLLLLKSYFLQLYIIPTGSMAETLAGEHAVHTCQNCGKHYEVGFNVPQGPNFVECPNCRWQTPTALQSGVGGVPLRSKAGDRIVVHGWPFDFGGSMGPQRWDVVVFKNPNEPNVNYIKRLIGLPGETIEIIDGDIWVKKPGEPELRVARKTRLVQDALWVPAYEHDYQPQKPSPDNIQARYVEQYGAHVAIGEDDWRLWKSHYPRWEVVGGDGWTNLKNRMFNFRPSGEGRGEIQFATSTDPAAPGMIVDELGYNAYNSRPDPRSGQPYYYRAIHAVTDVRLSADVRIESGAGYVELSVTKYRDRFTARLHADGRLTLGRSAGAEPEEIWSEARIAGGLASPRRISIGHADCEVLVEVDGKVALRSPAAFTESITPQIARQRRHFDDLQRRPMFPSVRIAAERVSADFSRVRLDRDAFYTSDVPGNGKPMGDSDLQHGNGTTDSPITLRDDAYFVCGDNSTNSLDARCWTPPPTPQLDAMLRDLAARGRENDVRRLLQGRLGPQLRERYDRGEYQIGTVAADQMLGRAFLVYWPGFMPEVRIGKFNVLPDVGHVRWIH